MWPPFRNDCNSCLLSHTETKHKQLVPISFTARSVSLSSPLQKLFCFAALNTEHVLICEHIWQECLQSTKSCSTAPEPKRLERWYCQTYTPTSFLPQDTIHSYINQKRQNLGDLVVPTGDHMNYSCLYIDISALNEQTGDLCQVTHISSSLRP